MIIAWLLAVASSYDCLTAMTNNWLKDAAWTSCYQAADQSIIGNTIGLLSSDWFGQSAIMTYDYNTAITFIPTSIT
jgi:hypothetical protein